jgi:hypothetical protein
MFGYPSAFVRGNYFAGLFEESVVLRLPEPLRGKLPELAHAAVFDPMRTGKGMRDWLVIPAKVASNAHALAALLEAALPLVATLPPKAKKPRKRPKKGDLYRFSKVHSRNWHHLASQHAGPYCGRNRLQLHACASRRCRK